MKKIVFTSVRKLYFYAIHYSLIPLVIREVFQKHRVSIILFHDPSLSNFVRLVEYLKAKYNLISFKQYLGALRNNGKLPKKALIITLDDGHIGNYSLKDYINQNGIPTTIFLCSGVIGTNRNYWFKFIKDSSVKDMLKNIPNSERLGHLKKMGFYQEQEHESPSALTLEMIKEMSPYIDFQSHTVFHPCLTMCTDEEAEYEISKSKIQLENLLKKEIDILSFPNGDYKERDINLAQKFGYKLAVTCDLGFNGSNVSPFRLKRQNCDDNASIYELEAKLTGIHFFILRLIGRFK